MPNAGVSQQVLVGSPQSPVGIQQTARKSRCRAACVMRQRCGVGCHAVTKTDWAWESQVYLTINDIPGRTELLLHSLHRAGPLVCPRLWVSRCG